MTPCEIPWCGRVHAQPVGERYHFRDIDTIDAGPLTTEVIVQQNDGDTEPLVRVFVGEYEGRYVDLTPQAAAELGRLVAGLKPAHVRYLARLLSTAGALLLGQ